ncbi:MAG: hypothetical protein ACLTTH_07615 [Holdemanella porci]
MKPTIVVSGINLFQGGTLTVYYNFCDEIIESKLYENIISYYLYIRYHCLKNTNLTLRLLNFQNHVKAGLKECIMSICTFKNILKTKISIYGFQFMT